MATNGVTGIPTNAGALQMGAVQNDATARLEAIARQDADGRLQRGATALDAKNGGTSGTSSYSSASSKSTDPGAIHMEKLKGDLKSSDPTVVKRAQAEIDAIKSKSTDSSSSTGGTSSTGSTTSAATDSTDSTNSTSSTSGWTAAGQKQLTKLEGNKNDAEKALGTFLNSNAGTSGSDSSQLDDLRTKYKEAQKAVTELKQSSSANDDATFDYPATNPYGFLSGRFGSSQDTQS
jgi:hypothetical protein